MYHPKGMEIIGQSSETNENVSVNVANLGWGEDEVRKNDKKVRGQQCLVSMACLFKRIWTQLEF